MFSRIGNAIDNFGTPALATTNGMVISVAVPLEETLAASTYSTAGGIINSSLVGSNIYYSGKGSGQASGGKLNNIKPNDELGKITGYKLKDGVDLDLRGTGKTYNDALDEAFKKTGIDKTNFLMV